MGTKEKRRNDEILKKAIKTYVSENEKEDLPDILLNLIKSIVDRRTEKADRVKERFLKKEKELNRDETIKKLRKQLRTAQESKKYFQNKLKEEIEDPRLSSQVRYEIFLLKEDLEKAKNKNIKLNDELRDLKKERTKLRNELKKYEA